MTVEECYTAIEGDYKGTLARFRDDARIQRFALKFLNDKSYEQLCTAFREQNFEDAFRAAHTLKGVGQNLGFTALYEPSDILTEKLRNKDFDGLEPLFEQVTAAYNRTFSGIKELQESIG